MFRKLSFASNVNKKEKVKSGKQTNLTSKSSAPDDDLDDVAVISNPDQVTYGSSYGSRGSITAINGPKVVPGCTVITSSGTGLIIQKSIESNQFKGQINKSQYSSIHSVARGLECDQESTNSSLVENKSNKLENDEVDDECIKNRSEQMRSNQMAISRLENRKQGFKGDKVYQREDNLAQQTDQETLEHDSRQDEPSEILESDQSETNDELDEDEEDEEDSDEKDLEIYDENDFDDKDHKLVKGKLIKSDYYQEKHAAVKLANSLLPSTVAQPTKSAYNSNQIPVHTILPHYIPSDYLITSATNSDKLSNADNHHLTRKASEIRKNEFKREYQRLDNQVYMMHSPSQNTSSNLNHFNHLTTNEKSGCNLSFVFDPSGRLCYFWEMIVSLAFLYNFWVIIYRFSFEEISNETMTVWLTIDSLADFIYLIDIGVHFRMAYLDEGVLQTDTKKLRQHYMNSTMFYIDCLCLLPSDILYLSMGFNSILRCFRIVKIYRFLSFLDRTERHTNYPNLFRTLTLTHYVLIIFHWNAAFYHVISKKGVFGQIDWFSGSKECINDVRCDYLHAFYWSTLALTLTGDLPKPQTKVEYIFLIIELVFGLLLTSVVLGHVSNIVTNVSAARKEFQARLDAVKTFMRIRRVPDHLKMKVIKWFDYLWMTKKSSDDECVGFLPAKLKAEIAIHVHLDTLKRVEIFQNTEAGFLCALVLRLKPILFSPGDYVCRKGEIGKEMYIVSKGKLQVVADGGKTVLATLRAGSYFGEISILNMGTAGNRRTASVRSVGYSDLFCLSKQDLWQVLKDYPAARLRLEAIASKRLKKYRKQPCSSKSHNHFYNQPSKHSGEELNISKKSKPRVKEDFLNQNLIATSRGGESLAAYHASRIYKQDHSLNNQFIAMNQYTPSQPNYPTHFQQPHLFHYSQINAQELELSKQLNNQQINLSNNMPANLQIKQGNMQQFNNLAGNFPVSNLQTVSTKPIVQNKHQNALVYGLTNFSPQNIQPQMSNLNRMQQLSLDHRAASALENKPLRSDNMESYSLNSYDQSLVASNQQLQQHPSNLYYTNSSKINLNQLNRINQPRTLSPNRSPLYLVHQNCKSVDTVLQSQSNLQTSNQANLQQIQSPNNRIASNDQKKNLIKSDENQLLLNEIQKLKENLKKVESEKEKLAIKLNRDTLEQAEKHWSDKVDKMERIDTSVDRTSNRSLNRIENVDRDKKFDKNDRKEKCVNKEDKKLVEINTNSGQMTQQKVRTIVDSGVSGQELKRQKVNVNQKMGDSKQTQLETRLDIDEESDEEMSERNKETII